MVLASHPVSDWLRLASVALLLAQGTAPSQAACRLQGAATTPEAIPGTRETGLSWRAEPGLLRARSAHALASTDTELFVVGGTGAAVAGGAAGRSAGAGAPEKLGEEPREAQPILEVERFDGSVWSVLTRLPGEGLNAPAAVIFERHLWVIGGFGTTSNVPVATVRVFDFASQAWSEAAPLPAARGGHAAVVFNGRIHVFGGGNSQSTLDDHCAFDAATRSWQVRAPLSRPKGSPAGLVFESRLWSIGGRSGAADFSDVECYDESTNRWNPGPAIPARGTAGAVVYRGSIWVLGGESQAQSRCLAGVLRLDSKSAAWVESTEMPLARNYARAAVLGDAIFVVGGNPSPGFSHAGLGSTRVESARLTDSPAPSTK